MGVFSALWSLLLVLIGQNSTFAFTCGALNSSETVFEREGSFKNITFLLNITESSTFSDNIRLTLDVCENSNLTTRCRFTWRDQSNEMAVRNYISRDETSCSAERRDIVSSMMTWEIKISQLVSRSLSSIYFYLENSTLHKRMIFETNLGVLYSSKVTNLTVDGQEVSNVHLINEQQEVNVSCFFVNGNPPVTFRLFDITSKEFATDKGSLHLSLSVKCEDDWPIVRCEGEGSELNRSVAFLVRCPPQFLDMLPKIVDHDSYEVWTFNIKAHTKTIDRCLLTKKALGEKFFMEVNCSTSGNPPDLVLTVFVDKKNMLERGHWTLTLRNDRGSSSTTSKAKRPPFPLCKNLRSIDAL